MEKQTETQTPIAEAATNPIAETQTPITEAAATPQSDIEEQPNIKEAQAESENAASLEKLKRWFGILRQVCQEDPRVVLQALQKPEKLILRSPDDIMAKRAEELRSTVDQEKTRKEFSQKGVDPEKALTVINFLRKNASQSYWPTDRSGSPDYDKEIEAHYQYNAEADFEFISELANISDDPAALLEDLNNIFPFKNIEYNKNNTLEYAKFVADNPRVREVINKIRVLPNLSKLHKTDDLAFWRDESGQTQVSIYENVSGNSVFSPDPLQDLANLDEQSFQELLSEENLVRVQELWARLAGKEAIKLELLPNLLQLAHNPQLETLFVQVIKANANNSSVEQAFASQILADSNEVSRFIWTVSRAEQILQEIPETITLLDNGFDLSSVLRSKFNSHKEATDIKQILDQQNELLSDYNNQDLMLNAKILKKYGLEMPLSNESREYYNFMRSSDPDRLEKALEIYEVTKDFYTNETDDDLRKNNARFSIWETIDNKLANFSVTEVSGLFQLLADQKGLLGDFDLYTSQVLENLDSFETLKERFQALADPKIQEMINDQLFNQTLKAHMGVESVGHSWQRWQVFFQAPDTYQDLYRQKDLFYQRMNDLNNEKLSFALDSKSLHYILQLSEADYLDFKNTCLTDAPHNIVNETLVNNYDLLKTMNPADQEYLLNELRSLGIKADSLFELNLADSNLYLNLSEKDRQQVFILVKKYQNYVDDILKVQSNFFLKNNKLQLNFFSELALNPDSQDRFFALLDYLNKNPALLIFNPLSQESNYNANYFVDFLVTRLSEGTFSLNEYINQDGTITEKFLESEVFQESFQKAYGFQLTGDFIGKLSQFYQDLHAPEYAALIVNPEAYWESNRGLMIRLEQIGWPVNNFDRFRSLVQNPETNDILSSVDVNLLNSLSKNIGLNPNNIYYVNKSSLYWLKSNLNNNEKRINFFKKILNEKPSSFKSCVTAFRSTGAEKIDQIVNEPLYFERLLEAMQEFRNITPSLITSYILNLNEAERAEYREKIDNFRHNVHRNVPIMPLSEGVGGIDFLTDAISLTFPSTNPDDIKFRLTELEDRCEDVANLKIREEGYQGKIVSKEKEAVLRDPNKTIDEGLINLIKVIFADQQGADYLAGGGDEAFAFRGWARLLVDAGATNQKALFKDNLQEVIACSRVSLGNQIDVFTEKMLGDTSQIAEKNTILNKAKELFGIYYKDNASSSIENFLQGHQEQVNTLLAKLSEKRLSALEKNIVNNKAMSEEDRLDFKDIISGLRLTDTNMNQKRQLLARLLSFMTERSIFAGGAGLRKVVQNEREKIILRDKEGQEIDPNSVVTAYLTKNAASFFAKTTAGLCTAGNVSLFNRPDHFHVNLVDAEEIVVGNIQGYQYNYNGQPALIFRGFNPSTSIISSTNAWILCDQMLDIIKQIAQDNNITQVFIPDDNGFHPLTNRVAEGVGQYFTHKFFRRENQAFFSFDITHDNIVDNFYRIPV